MILDKLLIDNLSNVGSYFINKAGLTAAPKNIDEMYLFLSSIRDSIKNKDLNGILLGNIFFSFVTSLDVRDRNVTARIFEDIFSGLFNTQSTDTTQRNNPIVPNYIRELDTLCQNEDWKISTDLSGNKREKCDLTINTYNISLKTLKGQAYDIEDKITDKSENTEINVGSLSYRSLLKGILPDSQLKALKDRKGGLGSKSQMQKNVYTPIKKLNILDRFIHRLSLFLNYIYEDDLYIVLKSNYRISFYLIPRNTFIQSLLLSVERNFELFSEIFYRWENNNLRLNWRKMLIAIKKYDLDYYLVSIKLQSCTTNPDFLDFKNNISNEIEKYIHQLN